MRKLCIAFLSSLFVLSGCAETYSIHINCNSDANNPVPPTARIFVEVEPNAENPLLANEVRAKIEKLLLKNSYEVVPDPCAADYQLSSNFGTAPREAMNYEKRSYSASGTRGPGTYMPYLEMNVDHWIQLKLYRADKVVWTGEARAMQQYIDERKMVDYLLVGVFEYFAHDSHGEQNMPIKEDDPRVTDLGS